MIGGVTVSEKSTPSGGAPSATRRWATPKRSDGTACSSLRVSASRSAELRCRRRKSVRTRRRSAAAKAASCSAAVRGSQSLVSIE